MTQDLDLDSLLQAAESLISSKSIQEDTVKITWTHSKSTIECLQCKRVYHGELFHSTAQEPKRRYVAWCPKCIDEKIWWLHQNFTIEHVEEYINDHQQISKPQTV